MIVLKNTMIHFLQLKIQYVNFAITVVQIVLLQEHRLAHFVMPEQITIEPLPFTLTTVFVTLDFMMTDFFYFVPNVI